MTKFNYRLCKKEKKRIGNTKTRYFSYFIIMAYYDRYTLCHCLFTYCDQLSAINNNMNCITFMCRLIATCFKSRT